MESRLEKKQLQEYSAQQPSLRVRMRELFQSDDIPEDLGLFPATLVFPADAPSLLSLQRYKMEWQRLVKRGKDFASIWLMKYTVGLRKHKLQLRKTAPTAMALHRQVYSAFADGDEGEVRRVATEGVRDKLITKIQARSGNTSYYWDLVRYVGRPRVVSHRASQMPIPESGDDAPSMLRQAVVRIQSVQRLAREDAKEGEGQVTQPVESEKRVTEYVVIQKRVLRGVEEPWKFWGTTEPTSLDDFEDALDVQPTASSAPGI